MNEGSLYTIAEVGITLTGFAGLAVAFLRRDLSSCLPGEFLSFLFLIANGLLVVPFALANSQGRRNGTREKCVTIKL